MSRLSCSAVFISEMNYGSALDRTNLGNARLQGLPQDILHGDPAGTLFDWANSAFFFSYVRIHSALLAFLTHRCASTGNLPGACSSHLEVLSSTHMDRLCRDLLGLIFDPHGSSLYPRDIAFVINSDVLAHRVTGLRVRLSRADCLPARLGRVRSRLRPRPPPLSL